MALHRVWLPSPNYSGRGGASVRLIVIHTAEGARTIESLGSFFANPGSGVSSHAGADDKANTVGEYVKRANKAWTQGNANPVAVALELCAFAAWSPAEWAAHPNMLANCAAWIAEEAAAFGIPIVRLSASQAQSNGVGVCSHQDLGSWGGGHTDPGPSFPWADVLAMAGGAPAPSAPPGPAPAPATKAPPFPGVILRDFTEGHGTATWQARMVERGWALAVDDLYGPSSADTCRDFQEDSTANGWPLAVDGEVGPETWRATWERPVTP
jgi:N-acetylmuramoyl-L-alanine amidase